MGGPRRENSKDNERGARQAGGRSCGQVLGRPTAQWTGRGTRRKGGTLSKYEKLAPLRFIKSKDHYGRSNQGPMQVGARPRSILDQTIGGRSTDLFFYWFNTIRGKDRTVPYRDKRKSQRILRALGIPLLCVFLVAGTEQQGKTRPTRPLLLKARGRALFKREWGVNRIRFRSWFGSGSSRSYS